MVGTTGDWEGVEYFFLENEHVAYPGEERLHEQWSDRARPRQVKRRSAWRFFRHSPTLSD